MCPRLARRDLLRGGAAALAGSLTGCLSALPPLGGAQTYGRIDVPPADPPDYRRWLPAPGAVDGAGDYPFVAARPGTADAGDPEEFLGRRAALVVEQDYLGVPFEAYDRFVATPYATVVEGEFGAETVADALLGGGYARDGSVRGYDLFARSDVSRRAAVRDGTVVWTSALRTDRADLEAVVETGAGDRRRYHEVSDAVAAVTEAAGASRQVLCAPELLSFHETAAYGADSFRFGPSATYQVITLRFPAGRVPSVETIERRYRAAHTWTEAAASLDAVVDGRTATVEARVPRRSAESLSPVEDPPQVTWGASHDAERRTVTFRHEAGDPVDAGILWGDVDTERRPGEVTETALFSGSDRVGPGDTGTVDLHGVGDPTHASVVVIPDPADVAFRTLFTYGLE
ncbi:MAG: hypothetical protein ABEJ43_03800 [Haloferacaceae archaeon]